MIAATTITVPADWPVRPIDVADVAELVLAGESESIAQCGGCGRFWNDGVSTSLTPAPSARCPFEPFHHGRCA